MSEITAQAVNEIFRDIKDYGEKNIGRRCGEDYPDIARALLECESFKSIQGAGVAMVMLMAMMSSGSGGDGKEKADRILEMAPLKDPLAEVFYAGYRLGKKEAEVDSLNNSMEGD